MGGSIITINCAFYDVIRRTVSVCYLQIAGISLMIYASYGWQHRPLLLTWLNCNSSMEVITATIMCEMKLLIYPQSSNMQPVKSVQPVKFGNW